MYLKYIVLCLFNNYGFEINWYWHISANRYTCKILIRKEGCKNNDLNMYKQEILYRVE